MLRRIAILFGLWTVPSMCLARLQTESPNEVEDEAERAEVDELAKTLAAFELETIQADYPDSWRDVSYIGEAHINERWTAIYCVTNDMKLLDRWSMRADRAIYPGKLMVYAIGQAGPIAGRNQGCNVVTLLICDRHSVELERVAFADLRAKYPRRISNGEDHSKQPELLA